MSQFAQALTVPPELDALWTTAQGYYDTLDQTFKQYGGISRPAFLWTEDQARTAFKLVKLFYDDLMTHRKANSTMVWGCDPLLCADPSCTNQPSICGTNNRKKIVENFLLWLTEGHGQLKGRGGTARTKQEVKNVIGTDTQILGVILNREPADDIRQMAAAAVGNAPLSWYLIPFANDPDKYLSWTVNALLGIMNGNPGGGSLGQVPSYKTVANAIMSLRAVATKDMPENIRSEVIKNIRSNMSNNAGQGGGLDIRLSGDRPGPWSQDERNKLYFQAVQLDSAITQLPIPVEPDPIPNPWNPPPGQVPPPGVYPPPKVGLFGEQTNLVFGIAAGAAVFAGVGVMLWLFRRGHGRRPTPPSLAPLGQARFPKATKVHTYVRRR